MRYRVVGTLSISDGPGCDWAGQRIPGSTLVEVEGEMDAETPRRAMHQVAWVAGQVATLGCGAMAGRHWASWEPWDVKVFDDQGRELLHDNGTAKMYERMGYQHGS